MFPGFKHAIWKNSAKICNLSGFALKSGRYGANRHKGTATPYENIKKKKKKKKGKEVLFP